MEGKGTVNRDDKKVKLTDANNQEILSGDGVLYSGDGPIEFPLNDGWNPKTIHALLKDINQYIRADEQGNSEIAFFMHPTSYFSFQEACRQMGVTQDNNIEGAGGQKIINNTYAGYEFGGLRILAHKSNAYDGRPGKLLKDGTRSNEWDTIAVPLGLTTGGQRGIELVQLRPMQQGKVAGIDSGLDNIATEIDGSSHHVLLQNGIISQQQVIKIGRNWASNLAA